MIPPKTGATREQIDEFVRWAIAELTLEEKVQMMSGEGFLEAYLEDGGEYNIRPYQTGGGNERLGLPALWFSDGPRGVAVNHSTSFPVAMARGASWDVELEERIGEAIGKELRALGANFYGAPCINLLRHPAWGRAQETYGEDPHHLGEMGAALVRGVQRHNVIATAKHFAANSIENARFKVDVRVTERVLREVYLPHFKRVVDEGVGSVMSAYNKVNGAYCGHNEHLLRHILKDDWGFEGFVHSDFVKGVYGPDAASCGLDIENPMTIHFGDELVAAVGRGEVTEEAIDEAVTRVLTTLYRFSTREDPCEYPESLVTCGEHRALARETVEKSAVLLRNEDGLLPLACDEIAGLALVGPLADTDNQGDLGSSYVRPPSVVTPLQGLRDYVKDRVTVFHDDGSDTESAARTAAAADVAVLVVGYTANEEGEFIPGDMTLSEDAEPASVGGDRDDLGLPENQEALIRAVAEVCPRTIVVVVGGSAVMMEGWRDRVGGILFLWYPGMEGGTGLARLLFGEANPSGKLPFTIPADLGQLPHFDKNADMIEYGPLHGYTLVEKSDASPAFPFGFGLSYTNFTYGPTQAAVDGKEVVATATITNVGSRDGRAVAQLYIGRADLAGADSLRSDDLSRSASNPDEPVRLLRGFRIVPLTAGASAVVEFRIAVTELARFDEAAAAFVVEPGAYSVVVAADAAEAARAAESNEFGDSQTSSSAIEIRQPIWAK